MDEEIMLIKIVKEKCKKSGISYDALSKHTQQTLIAFERDYYQPTENKVNECKSFLKHNHMSIKSIAMAINISRQAIYKQPVLVEYFNYSENVLNRKQNKCYKKCEKMIELLRTNEASQNCITENMDLKYKNQELLERLSESNMQKKIEQLENEIKYLRGIIKENEIDTPENPKILN